MHSHPNIELYPKPMTRPGRNSLVHVDSKARVGHLHGTLKNRIAYSFLNCQRSIEPPP